MNDKASADAAVAQGDMKNTNSPEMFQKACDFVLHTFKEITMEGYGMKTFESHYPSVVPMLSLLLTQNQWKLEVIADYFTLPSGHQDVEMVCAIENEIKTIQENQFHHSCEDLVADFQSLNEHDIAILIKEFPTILPMLIYLHDQKKLTVDVAIDYFTFPNGEEDREVVAHLVHRMEDMKHERMMHEIPEEFFQLCKTLMEEIDVAEKEELESFTKQFPRYGPPLLEFKKELWEVNTIIEFFTFDSGLEDMETVQHLVHALEARHDDEGAEDPQFKEDCEIAQELFLTFDEDDYADLSREHPIITPIFQNDHTLEDTIRMHEHLKGFEIPLHNFVHSLTQLNQQKFMDAVTLLVYEMKQTFLDGLGVKQLTTAYPSVLPMLIEFVKRRQFNPQFVAMYFTLPSGTPDRQLVNDILHSILELKFKRFQKICQELVDALVSIENKPDLLENLRAMHPVIFPVLEDFIHDGKLDQAEVIRYFTLPDESISTNRVKKVLDSIEAIREKEFQLKCKSLLAGVSEASESVIQLLTLEFPHAIKPLFQAEVLDLRIVKAQFHEDDELLAQVLDALAIIKQVEIQQHASMDDAEIWGSPDMVEEDSMEVPDMQMQPKESPETPEKRMNIPKTQMKMNKPSENKREPKTIEKREKLEKRDLKPIDTYTKTQEKRFHDGGKKHSKKDHHEKRDRKAAREREKLYQKAYERHEHRKRYHKNNKKRRKDRVSAYKMLDNNNVIQFNVDNAYFYRSAWDSSSSESESRTPSRSMSDVTEFTEFPQRPKHQLQSLPPPSYTYSMRPGLPIMYAPIMPGPSMYNNYRYPNAQPVYPYPMQPITFDLGKRRPEPHMFQNSMAPSMNPMYNMNPMTPQMNPMYMNIGGSFLPDDPIKRDPRHKRHHHGHHHGHHHHHHHHHGKSHRKQHRRRPSKTMKIRKKLKQKARYRKNSAPTRRNFYE